MEELVITVCGDDAQKGCLNIYPWLAMTSRFKIVYNCHDIHEIDTRQIRASIVNKMPYFIKGSYANVNEPFNKQRVVLLVDGCKYKCFVGKNEANIYDIFIADQIIDNNN